MGQKKASSHSLAITIEMHITRQREKSEAEFLDVIGTNVFGVSLLLSQPPLLTDFTPLPLEEKVV